MVLCGNGVSALCVWGWGAVLFLSTLEYTYRCDEWGCVR